MARIEQALADNNAALGFVKHQRIGLADAEFKQHDQHAHHDDGSGAQTQQNIHDLCLLRLAVSYTERK